MDIRITKIRAALAALFVLAGVGLASILSPLVGSALATVGQTVNLSDHSASAFFAKVDSSGALKTTAAVTGRVAPTLPPQPFYTSRSVHAADGAVAVLGPATATVALTDLGIANDFFNTGARFVSFLEASAPAPNSSCTEVHTRDLGFYDVQSSDSIHANYETPIVLKPLASGEAWCLLVSVSEPAGDTDQVVGVSVGGYVVSGTFAPPSSGPPAATLRPHRFKK